MEKGIDIQFSEKALTFIKTRRLNAPLVLVSLGFRETGGDSGCSGGGCSGGGGGCGEGNSAPCIPYANVVMVDGRTPGDLFARVDTQAGIPVYLAKSLLDSARRSEHPLIINLKGLVMKKLSLEGLDMERLARERAEKAEKCH